MANTADTLKTAHVLEVTYTDSGADWNYSDNGGFRTWITIKSIVWYPSGANDILVINDGSNDGPSIIHVQASADDDSKIFEFSPPYRCKPYIDLTDCTFNAVASTKIIFHLA